MPRWGQFRSRSDPQHHRSRPPFHLGPSETSQEPRTILSHQSLTAKSECIYPKEKCSCQERDRWGKPGLLSCLRGKRHEGGRSQTEWGLKPRSTAGQCEVLARHIDSLSLRCSLWKMGISAVASSCSDDKLCLRSQRPPCPKPSPKPSSRLRSVNGSSERVRGGTVESSLYLVLGCCGGRTHLH